MTTANRLAIAAYLVLTGFFLALYLGAPEVFLTSVEEDRWVEWGTVFGYLLASIGFVIVLLRTRGRAGRFSWFYVLLALGCFFVAGEEISWGQRLIGLKTPAVFVEHNFQREVNIHNLGEWGRDWPRRIYIFAVFAYVGVLPLAASRWAALRSALERWGVIVPAGLLFVPYACSMVLPVLTQVLGRLDTGITLYPGYVVEVTEFFSGLLFAHFAALELSKTRVATPVPAAPV